MNHRSRVLLASLGVVVLSAMALRAQQAEIDEAKKQVKAAQEKSDWAGVVQSGLALNALLTKALAATKPEDATAEFWKGSQESWKAEKVQAEYACFDASIRETDPAKKVKLLEQFTAGFAGGDYAKRALSTLAGVYQQTGDRANALATAKKVLEVEPDNEGMHLMLADAALGSKQLSSAVEHSRAALKALEGKKKPEGYSDEQWATYSKTINGSAHSTAGQALMLQEKTEAAIPELKSATELLAGNNQLLAPALYNLAFAYAKLQKKLEARAVLTKAVTIPGPYQQLSKDLAVKIGK